MSVNRFFQPRALHPFSSSFNDSLLHHLEHEMTTAAKLPAMDLLETKSDYVVKADVPGYAKDDISVDVEGNHLLIKGHWSKEKEDKEGNVFHSKERSESSFQRSIALRGVISPSSIKASLKDGVLQVTVPKDQGKLQAKIQIE